MLNEIAIELEKAEVEQYRDAAREVDVDLEAYELKRFDGGVAFAAVVIPILSATLPLVTKMIIAQIQARRHVTVKVDGVEIRGLGSKDVGKLLESIWTAKAKGDA